MHCAVHKKGKNWDTDFEAKRQFKFSRLIDLKDLFESKLKVEMANIS